MCQKQYKHAATLFSERGSVLIILVLILIVGVAGLMLSGVGRISSRPAVQLDGVTKQALFAAKDGLFTWASMRGTTGLTGTIVPPGLLPYPDTRTGAYDGRSDCSSGAATFATNYGKLPIFGEKLPCRGGGAGPDLGLQILDARDSARETLWFAASPNLLDNLDDAQPINLSSTLLSQANGWLVVCDQGGRLLSSTVAFVVISPGIALTGQNRAGAATARNFLDAYPLTGIAPCNNPAESNFDNNAVYISNLGRATSFNDQLLYVTRNEYFTWIVKVVAKHVSRHLEQIVQNTGVFPYAANAGSAGDCVNGLSSGSVPVECTGFTGIQYMALDGPWHQAIVYSVDALRTTATFSFQNCPGMIFQYSYVNNAFSFTSTGERCLNNEN